MQNQRFFLWAALALVLFLIWQSWQEDYGHVAAPPEPAAGQPDEVTAAQDSDLPVLPESGPATPSETSPQPILPRDETARTTGQRIRVTTDVLEIDIGNNGGTLLRTDLLKYHRRNGDADETVRLLDAAAGYVIESGLVLQGEGGGEPIYLHQKEFSTPQSSYTLADGAEQLVVPLTWQHNGLKITKNYTFRRGQYEILINYRLENANPETLRGATYAQILRPYRAVERSMFDVETFSFSGPMIYDGKDYEKLDFEDIVKQPISEPVTGGWLAMIEHHFLSAIVPEATQPTELSVAVVDGSDERLRVVGPASAVVANGDSTFSQVLFVGPKLQDQLEEIGSKLELTVDYGMLTVIAQPLYWVLNKIHSVIGNWGWAIVLLTLLVKLVFYKLAETSGRSMAKMRRLQPRMKALQERYKDDRQKLSEATMRLYKEEKVNPASGCLPLLVQMPVFFALYWVLIESVELRHAPWILWIHDLSIRDPYFVLPVLMGISMYFMQKLNQQPVDPIQQKVLSFMPLMLTGMMAFFPAGLVLYWLTNNLLSTAQQWRINKVVEKER